jgi:hypothetical protein
MNRVSKLAIVATAGLAALGTTAFAQDPGGAVGGDPAAPLPPPGVAPAPAGAGSKILGVDGALVLPLSDYGDAADFGAGILGRFEFGIDDKLAITGRLGFLYHFGTPEVLGADTSLAFIPIYAGAKYVIESDIFACGELGLTYVLSSVGDVSDSEIKLGLTLGVGYQMDKLQFRGMILAPDMSELDSVIGIMGSVGYDITAL